MTDKGRDITQTTRDGTARKPLGDAEIAALVDGLAPHLSGEMRPRPDLLSPATRQIHERLRANPGGKVSAALNRLSGRHPAVVLTETARAVLAALDQTRIEVSTRSTVEKHRGIARLARGLAHEIDEVFLPGSIALAARDLRLIAQIEADYATMLAQGMRKARFSRKKANPRAAIVGAAARRLADQLWGKFRVDREALRWLLGAALGCEISDAETKAAIRSERRTRGHSDG